MSKVTLQGYIVVADADLAAVERALPEHIGLTLEEEGCLAFKVLQDRDNANRFNVYEQFASQASFERHQQRVRDSKWGTLTIDVERYYQVKGAV